MWQKNDANAKFKALMDKEYQAIPGFYAASMYVTVQVVEAAMRALHGDMSKPEQTIKALRAVNLKDTARGPLRFDDLGNAVGSMYVRTIVKDGGKLTNVTQKTYENVSQFWPYDEAKYLAQPAYARDYPPLKT